MMPHATNEQSSDSASKFHEISALSAISAEISRLPLATFDFRDGYSTKPPIGREPRFTTRSHDRIAITRNLQLIENAIARGSQITYGDLEIASESLLAASEDGRWKGRLANIHQILNAGSFICHSSDLQVIISLADRAESIRVSCEALVTFLDVACGTEGKAIRKASEEDKPKVRRCMDRRGEATAEYLLLLDQAKGCWEKLAGIVGEMASGNAVSTPPSPGTVAGEDGPAWQPGEWEAWGQ